MSEDQLIITAEEAEALLNDGETVHNFVASGAMVLGCDFSRTAAIDAFRRAALIEIGGPSCKAMRHPIVVHEDDGRYSFFEANMSKVSALEAAREPRP